MLDDWVNTGVYVLGAADAEESRRVQAHLPGCPACRAELALLTPLPDLLARVPGDTVAAGAETPAAELKQIFSAAP